MSAMNNLTVEQARMMRGISQEEMANYLGLCKNSYILKEKGKRRFYVDEAVKFCEIVNVPWSNIIFFYANVPKK